MHWHGVCSANTKTLKKSRGTARSAVKLNVRKGAPSTKSPIANTVGVGQTLQYVGWVINGEPINGNAKWFKRGQDFLERGSGVSRISHTSMCIGLPMYQTIEVFHDA